ncbi:hypothetical protein [Kineococcus rhizosphaerae]|uniref:Uncharacterized protein n=1 Tax=Kineococcus rhizosphaerae TaxID=559628 RepID=A0A2T0QX35_9ACTN|nr:hypothetical protein [Kineococcus rhizosphaerae]PRY10061.1 hypothetical protein CLV37_11831 [Kineococcus rhizosphaerae]
MACVVDFPSAAAVQITGEATDETVAGIEPLSELSAQFPDLHRVGSGLSPLRRAGRADGDNHPAPHPTTSTLNPSERKHR